MKKAFKDIIKERKYELAGICLIVAAILNASHLSSKDTGIIGEVFATGLRFVIGQGIYLVPVVLFFWGISLIYSSKAKIKVSPRAIGIIIILIVILIIFHLKIEHPNELKAGLNGQGGGIVGGALLYILRKSFAQLGTYVLLFAASLVGVLLIADILLINLLMKLKGKYQNISTKIKENFPNYKPFNQDGKLISLFNKFKTKEADQLRNELASQEEQDKSINNTAAIISNSKQEVAVNKADSTKNNYKLDTQTKKREKFEQQQLEINGYKLPSLALLNETKKKQGTFNDKTNILKKTLDNFGVEAEVTNVNYGPTITRYEIQPAPGVKVSRILSLADDIALSLAASDVRIEAPIPGKSVVGIEIPNQNQSLVTIKEMLGAKEFQVAESKLTIALGKDIGGQPVVADLSKMPHMLVAGATGSGKSVFINTVINSILYKATMEQVKFLLIDPKMVEFTIYKGIPHLISPVVTDSKKASTALRWVVQEMENRYELFAGSGARGIDSYNQNLEEDDKDPLPYIVVIIDELADLMMVAASEVEDAICRLAQKARAAGIHLILATQRPSVDVITGVIKANIPTRVSFSLSSQADSRTILDTGGAEKLLGKGDMLFAPVGSNQPKRLQGAFISDDELQRIVEFVKQQEKPEYADEIANIKEDNVNIELDDERDELYEKAVKLVVENRASISMLQRKLRVGYNRAARMIDTMEKENIVGPHRGSKARKVLIDKEDLEKILDK